MMCLSYLQGVFILFCQAYIVFAGYELEVRLLSYSNPTSLRFTGDICDNIFSPCDNSFTFCLRFPGDFRNTDRFNCSLGGPVTTVTFQDDDSIDFSSMTMIGSLPNPLVFTGDSWPGGFQLFIRVTDSDILFDDVVDNLLTTIPLLVNDSFTAPLTIQGSAVNRASMRLSLRVKCSRGSDGVNCTDVGICFDDVACDVNARCNNFLGDNYACECNEGFEGDGLTCSESDFPVAGAIVAGVFLVVIIAVITVIILTIIICKHQKKKNTTESVTPVNIPANNTYQQTPPQDTLSPPQYSEPTAYTPPIPGINNVREPQTPAYEIIYTPAHQYSQPGPPPSPSVPTSNPPAPSAPYAHYSRTSHPSSSQAGPVTPAQQVGPVTGKHSGSSPADDMNSNEYSHLQTSHETTTPSAPTLEVLTEHS